jgi:glutathione S-transferase/maleylpyruvate isomerase
MLTIYTIPVSLYCAKLRLLLRHKGLGWQELAPPGGYGSKEYRQLVPAGNLPALKDGDLLLSDSEAIAEYLNEKYSIPAMLPDDISVRANIRQLSRFHDTRMEPAVRALFSFLPPSPGDPAFFEAQFTKINTRLQQLAQVLEDGHAVEELTLGDCGFPITFVWLDVLSSLFEQTIEWPEAVAAYRSKIEQHPAVAAELSDYVPKLTHWLADLPRS